jgi:hypothetical protein
MADSALLDPEAPRVLIVAADASVGAFDMIVLGVVHLAIVLVAAMGLPPYNWQPRRSSVR